MNNPSSEKQTDSGSWIERLWHSIQERARVHGRGLGRDIPALDRAKTLAEALLSERGEASGAIVAQELHACLRDLDTGERLKFYHFLAAGFQPDEARLKAAAQAYLEEATPERAALLTEAAEPARQELLRRLNMSSGGTAALVAIRQELLTHLRDEPALQPLAFDLYHLLSSWFNRGFLELRRIDWETPAAILEKLIAHEAVHEIQGWTDLRRRLAADRRCFGFFHPGLPGEPLIFVEVALVQGIAPAVQPLLNCEMDEATARDNEALADTAIFYSISNCQDGLRGISFGNFLIKHVVEKLKAELPQIVRFATLSPVPGFRRWLEKYLFRQRDAVLVELLHEEDRTVLLQAAEADETGDAVAALEHLLDMEMWWENKRTASALREPMLRLCAAYLTLADENMKPADPVAGFHLRNGARLEYINWLGNLAPRGIKESYGLMANYLYDPESIEANHEAFVREGIVPHSGAVDSLLASVTPAGRRLPRLPVHRLRGG